MAELVAKTPCGDLLPRTIGELVLEEVDLGQLSLIALTGDAAALSEALQAAHGIAFPAPNRMTGKNDPRCIWFGRNQALLIGAAPDENLGKNAAIVDQSDGWTAVTLRGPQAEDVLARLVPLDLRAQHFEAGHTARTQLGHMAASITRTGDDAFMILVFRSMASTLVDELDHAMRGVASRR